MPRNKIHPSLLVGGEPKHGTAYEAEIDEDEDLDDEDEDEQHEVDPKPKDPTQERLERLEAENARLRGDIETTRRLIPPHEPRRQEDEDEEVDWDTLMFSDPAAAVKRIKEDARKEITRELRSEYQKDQGTQSFWQDFNRAHPDLKEDRDLVELTMNKNMATLANLPVADAIDQLADLTRKRILGYSGKGTSKRRNRSVVTGADEATERRHQTPQPRREEGKVLTLSDIIRDRRAKRFSKGRGQAA